MTMKLSALQLSLKTLLDIFYSTIAQSVGFGFKPSVVPWECLDPDCHTSLSSDLHVELTDINDRYKCEGTTSSLWVQGPV